MMKEKYHWNYMEKGSYQIIKRMIKGKKIIIHGDGESL